MVQIFVYGTLKRGSCRSHVLKNQRFVGEAKTVAEYRMYNTGSFPALVEDEHGVPVEGEVWEVDENCLRILDAVEGVPILYKRKPVVLATPSLAEVETYIYQKSVDGMPDCGNRWNRDQEPVLRTGKFGR